MADMSLTKTPIAEQPPEERVCNFKEVTLGYTAEEAIKEAGIGERDKVTIGGDGVEVGNLIGKKEDGR